MCIGKEYRIFLVNNKDGLMLTNKVIGVFFNYFRDVVESEKNYSVEKKKIILNKFSQVIRALRRELLGVNNLYENQQDDIEVLIELSETTDIPGVIASLTDELEEYCGLDIKINIWCDNKKNIEKEIYNMFSEKVQSKFVIREIKTT